MPADHPDFKTRLRYGEACLKTVFGQYSYSVCVGAQNRNGCVCIVEPHRRQ